MIEPKTITLEKLINFKHTLSKGKKIVTDSFVLIYEIDNTVSNLSYGIIASKKVGGAVQRNRSKRLLRSIIRSVSDKIKKGGRVILIARANILQQTFVQITKNLDYTFSRQFCSVKNTLNKTSLYKKYQDNKKILVENNMSAIC